MSTGGTLGLDDESGSRAAGDSPNIAAVRRISDAFNRLDLDAVVGDLDPEVELSEWPTAPGAQTYRGRDGVRQALATWFEAWEWMQAEIKDCLETGDRVFVTAHQRAKGRGSAVQVEIESYNVYTFRDAKVIRIELFTEREPALHAAGLTPNPEEAKR